MPRIIYSPWGTLCFVTHENVIIRLGTYWFVVYLLLQTLSLLHVLSMTKSKRPKCKNKFISKSETTTAGPMGFQDVVDSDVRVYSSDDVRVYSSDDVRVCSSDDESSTSDDIVRWHMESCSLQTQSRTCWFAEKLNSPDKQITLRNNLHFIVLLLLPMASITWSVNILVVQENSNTNPFLV